jgi:hypothetical protein
VGGQSGSWSQAGPRRGSEASHPLILIALMAYAVFIPAGALPQEIGLGTTVTLTLMRIAYLASGAAQGLRQWSCSGTCTTSSSEAGQGRLKRMRPGSIRRPPATSASWTPSSAATMVSQSWLAGTSLGRRATPMPGCDPGG